MRWPRLVKPLADLTCWHDWFAWRPVKIVVAAPNSLADPLAQLTVSITVWWETVERKGTYHVHVRPVRTWWTWEYRLPRFTA